MDVASTLNATKYLNNYLEREELQGVFFVGDVGAIFLDGVAW